MAARVYDELRRIARRYMRDEREGHTLQTTALVNEVYLPISNGGAFGPQWRGDEKELYYSTPDNKLVAVEVSAQGSEFVAGTPKVLFPLKAAPTTFDTLFWAPTPNSQQFLVLRPVGIAHGIPITIVINWQAGLREKSSGTWTASRQRPVGCRSCASNGLVR